MSKRQHTLRNWRIYWARRNGDSCAAIAERERLTQQRVYQIAKQYAVRRAHENVLLNRAMCRLVQALFGSVMVDLVTGMPLDPMILELDWHYDTVEDSET